MVIGKRFELLQLAEIGHPAVADRVSDRSGERRVGPQQPAPRRHAVGLVVEPLRKHVGQILDRRLSQEFGVDRRNPVGAVRPDNGHVRHAYPAPAILLDEAHPADAPVISWKAAPDVVEKAAIDLVDDLEVARQQQFEPGKRPFFEGFWQ